MSEQAPAGSGRIYLDHAATTPIRPEVRAAMAEVLSSVHGNPSSLHREGREAREALEGARETVQRRLGAASYRLVFTGGGTEADNTAIVGAVLARLGGLGHTRPGDLHVVASAVEHSAVHGALEQLELWGVPTTLVGVDRDGRVDPGEVFRTLRTQTALVSVMAVNNETGTLEPIREIAAGLAERGVPFHSDAIQLLGKLPFDLCEFPLDLVSLSAHKIYGPKGVGAVLVRDDIPFAGFIRGGPQEDTLRGGTESVASIVGFARAVELALDELPGESQRLSDLRDRFHHGIEERIEGVSFNTPPNGAAPHIVNVSFDAVEGESLLTLLDHFGLAVSTGSACNVGAKLPSRVLAAMGRERDQIRGSIRFSFGRDTTAETTDVALDRLEEAVNQLRALSPVRARQR